MCLSIHQVLRRVWLCYSASRRLYSSSLFPYFPAFCPLLFPFNPFECSSSSSSSLDPLRLKSETGAVHPIKFEKSRTRRPLLSQLFADTRRPNNRENFSRTTANLDISISRYLEGKNGPVDPIGIELISPRHLVLDGWMDGWRRM